MAAVALKCPFCGSEDVRSYGTANGKKRYACNNSAYSHKTFYAEYTYKGCKPSVKKDIIKWATDGNENTGNSAGIRGKRRYRDKRIKKKEDMIEYVNKWAIDHESGEAIAFWFGRREHGNLDKLLGLLAPLNLGKVYTDGNYAYYERFTPEVLVVTKKNTQKIERKHLSLWTWSARLVRKGIRFSKIAQTRKIVVAMTINIWSLGECVCSNNFRTLPAFPYPAFVHRMYQELELSPRA